MELEMTSMMLSRFMENAQSTEGEVYHEMNQLNPKKSCLEGNLDFAAVEIVNDLSKLY